MVAAGWLIVTRLDSNATQHITTHHNITHYNLNEPLACFEASMGLHTGRL
jgi:hypothetical protein